MYIHDLLNLEDELDSIKAIEEPVFFNEEECVELYDTCFHIIEEFMKDNIRYISEPDFHDDFDENIEELMHSHFDFDLFYTEEAQEEMEEIIERAKNDYFKLHMHPRSYEKSIIIEEPDYDYIKEQINYLKGKPQPEQRTKEWYQFRYNLITASNAWKAFESTATQNQLIYEKCQPLDLNSFIEEEQEEDESIKKIIEVKMVNVNTTLHWGQKYEPLSVQIYEHVYDTKIGDFGCIQHDDYPFLGASPDGINIEPSSKRYGRMLEIKNIVNREIDGIPKKEYWIQMQLQMEVCDLDECDFLETKFIEYSGLNEFNEDTLECVSYTDDDEPEEFIDYYVSKEKKMKGIILHFHTKEGKPLYIYKPLDLVHPEDVEQWIEENIDLYESSNYGHIFLKTIYWKLEHISCVLVCRNREWFKNVVEDLESVWSIIEKERISGYEHRAPNKKVKKDLNSLEINLDEKTVNNCLLKFFKPQDSSKPKDSDITVIKSI